MPQQLCKLCGQWLSQGNPDWQKHFHSPRHQQKLQQLEQRKQEQEASVFITGFRTMKETFSVEMLLACLNEFGKIKCYFMGKNNTYGIFTFESKEVALKVLNAPPKIGEQTLIVRPRKKKQNRDGSLEDLIPMPGLTKIFTIDTIPNVGSWECQAEHLARMLGMPQVPQNPWENTRLMHLCRDIKMVLGSGFPNCAVFVFGSTITGLAGTDSDVDIFVDLSPDFEVMPKVRQTQRLQNPTKFHEEIFEQCFQALNKRQSGFDNAYRIPKARTPVIKCLHLATQIQIDINFKNFLCIINTNLLKYYFHLDHRVKQMITLLKYFLKVQNLPFSSYSFSFILLFFLMNLEKPLIPPVTAVLVPQTDNANDFSEEMWKVQFKHLEFKSENQQSLKELLADFFHFVRTFDYGIYVMCPLTGEAVPRWKFLQVETLPPAMRKLQLAMDHKQQSFPAKNSVMAVQDPLELVHNITKSVTDKHHFKNFLELCKAAEDLCKSEKGLIELVSLDPAETPVWSETSWHCVELMCYNYIPPLAKLETGDDIRDIWFTHAKEVIGDIFSYVFHFEDVSESDGMSSPPHKLPKVESTMWSQNKTLQTKFCLWNSRKRIKSESKTPANLTFAEEVDVSIKLLQLFYVNTASLKPNIKIQIKLTQQQAPTRIQMEILDVSSEKTVLFSFINYLTGNLQSLLNKGLAESYKEKIDMRSAEDIVIQSVSKSGSNESILKSDTQVLLQGTLDKLKSADDIAKGEDAKSDGPKVTSGNIQSSDAQTILMGTFDKLSAENSLRQPAPQIDVPSENAGKKESCDAQALLMSGLFKITGSSSSTSETDSVKEETSDAQSQPHCEQKKLTKEERSPLRFLLKQAGEKSTPEPSTSQPQILPNLTSPASFKLSNTRSDSPQPSKYGPKRKHNVQTQSGSVSSSPSEESADHPMET